MTAAHRPWIALLAASLAGFAASTTSAQSTSSGPAADDDGVVEMPAYTVTGSNLPLAGETPTAPVRMLGQVEMANTGVNNNLLEVIRKSVPQFSGNANLGNSNGNVDSGSTNGGSRLALRNAATLVLVNGRRMANSPVAAVGGDVFVDVNMIPVSAIDRVEVLTDGASAIYGADAVGGVVNIILRSDYQGGEIGGRYAVTQNEGNYEERSAYAVVGGTIQKTGTRLTASAEWSKTDPIYNYERDFATPSYGTTNFAGVIQVRENADAVGRYYYLDPALDRPGSSGSLEDRGYRFLGTSSLDVLPLFNLASGVTMLIADERQAATVSLDQPLGPRVTAFADFLYSETDTLSQLNAQPIAITMEPDDPNNPLGELGLIVSVRNRFVSDPRQYLATTDAFRVVAGLRGELSQQWTWEVAASYNPSSQDFANSGLVRSAAREQHVSDGSLDLFARSQDPAVLAEVFGAAAGHYDSNRVSIDMKVVGQDLLHLPGGGVAVAAGAAWSRESLRATSDPDSQSATFAYDSGTSIDPFNDSRKVTSVFGEARVPIVGDGNRLPGVYVLDFTAAVRSEAYSDTEGTVVPKFSLRWQPDARSWLFRTTYSESYSTPTIYQMHTPTGFGFTPQVNQFGQNQAWLQTTPPGGLQPSKAKSVTAGVVWTPAKVREFSLSLDYFHIDQTDLISAVWDDGVIQPVLVDVENRGAASPFAQYVHVDDYSGPTVSAPGQISALGLDRIYIVAASSANIGGQKIRGFDFNLGYSLEALGGRFDLHSATAYYLDYDIQPIPGLAYQETAAKATALNGTIPRFRTYTTLTYAAGPVSATVGNTFYPAVDDYEYDPAAAANGDYPKPYGPRTKRYVSWDASVSCLFPTPWLKLNDFKVTLGVNNLTNEMPPLVVAENGNSNADIAEFSPVGRLFYVEGRLRF